MHTYFLPMVAAFACALCNGTAAVLQKISADKEKPVNSLDAGLLWRLFQDRPYIGGVILDLLGWAFTLYAVHSLPLFLVEAVIAGNIIVTALIERVFRHRLLSPQAYMAIVGIVMGLVLLAVAASPQKAKPISDTLRELIFITPVVVAAGGFVIARSKHHAAAIGLAALGGLAFGATSVIGRIFTFSQPHWHTIYSPQVPALIISGVVGILLFSIALQRAQATLINATMTASQTLIPAIIGVVFLGDSARGGLWYLVVLGAVLALGGVAFLAFSQHTEVVASGLSA